MSLFSIIFAAVIPLAQLDESFDEREVTVEGTVVEVTTDEIDPRYSIILLKEGAATMPLFVLNSPPRESLIDARIRADGVYMRLTSGFRRYLGPLIVSSSSSPVVLSPPADPFSAPPISPADFVPQKEVAAMGRRTLNCFVLAVWGGNRLMVYGDRHVVNVTLKEGVVPPSIGETVLISGYPETDFYRLNFCKAIWRKSADGHVVAEPPVFYSARDIMTRGEWPHKIDQRVHGSLITLRGIVQGLPGKGTGERRIFLNCDGYTIGVDYSSFPAAADGLEIGFGVELTGRAFMETENWNLYNVFPQIRGFSVIAVSDDAFRIVSRPSWLTPARCGYLAAFLLFVAAVFCIVLRVQRRIARARLEERTRLAVEIHDSLSQTLTGLACQIAGYHDFIADRMLESCRTELRNCLFDLRNNTIGEKDFSSAIRRTLEPFMCDTSIRIRVSIPRDRMDDTAAHDLLVIIRELVANAIRHGSAATVLVAGTADRSRIRLSVRDDGSGFDTASVEGVALGHFGLSGIRHRLERYSGTLKVVSAPEKGTYVRVTL